MHAGDGELDVGVDVVDGGAGAGGSGGAGGGAGGRRRRRRRDRLRPDRRRGRIACGGAPRLPPARKPCPTRTCTRARPAGPSDCRTTTWCPATLASHPANTTDAV